MHSRGILYDCYEQLRRVEFDERLRNAVATHERAWQDLPDEEDWLLGRLVTAEVHDYFGDYELAVAALDPQDSRVRDSITPHDTTADPHKRRIWLTIAFAHIKYRQEDYVTAAAHLSAARKRLNGLDAHEERYFGTRARLSYSLGQVARQTQRYDEALRHFADVAEFAAERFRQKTPFLELVGPPGEERVLSEADERTLRKERGLAVWTIGKSLAFGVGWIHYTTGNLRVARLALNSGYAMLRSTGDWIHRAYAQLLLAATERARGSQEPRRLLDAVRRVEESANGLSRHRAFRGRASYEKALAQLHINDPAGALEAVADARKHFSGVKATKVSRWTCSLLVLESRAHRMQKAWSEATRAARAAHDIAVDGGQASSRIDALLAKAEVTIEHAQTLAEGEAKRDWLGRAVSDIRDAQALLRGHPNAKLEAACWLHLARAYRRLDNLVEARQHFGMWLQYVDRVQHGFLHKLAATISEEIGVVGDRFIVPSTSETLKVDDHERELRAFLIKTAAERARSLDEQATMLGLTPDYLRKLRDDLSKAGKDVGKRHGRTGRE